MEVKLKCLYECVSVAVSPPMSKPLWLQNVLRLHGTYMQQKAQ